MAAYGEALSETSMQEKRSSARVLDDIGDGRLRTKAVFDQGDGIAACISAPRPVAEHRDIERAPITAVQDDEERQARFLTIGMEQVDLVPRVRTVGNADLGVP